MIGAIFAGYLLLALALILIEGGSFFTPDRIILLLAPSAFVLGRGRAFLRDWIPFVLLLSGYEMMRGFADNFSDLGTLSANDHGRVQVSWLIDADRWLFFGHLPSVWLQDRLYTPGATHWYDVAAAVIYLFHFFLPLVFGFALWLRSREEFRRFTAALLLVSYAAFGFFLLLPTAPPWLAQEWGYIDGLQRPSEGAFRVFLPERFQSFDTFKLWTGISPNKVAAFPSLHAAFPFLVLLFAVRTWRWWGLAILLPYNAAVWFSIVYLSQHWVVDAIAGALWASFCYLVILGVWYAHDQRELVRSRASFANPLPAT